MITEHMESNVLHSYQADLMRSSVNKLRREIQGLRSDISLLRSDAYSARMAEPGDPPHLRERIERWYRTPYWKHLLNPLRWLGYPTAMLFALKYRNMTRLTGRLHRTRREYLGCRSGLTGAKSVSRGDGTQRDDRLPWHSGVRLQIERTRWASQIVGTPKHVDAWVQTGRCEDSLVIGFEGGARGCDEADAVDRFALNAHR